MKLIRKDAYGGKNHDRSIAEAVDEHVEPSTYGYGGDEAAKARDHTRNLTEMMGRLIQRLHDKDALNNEDVVAVIGHGWRDAADPAPEEDED